MPIQLGCIVEGHGEVESVPVLVRRIAQSVYAALAVLVPPPVRIPKSKLLKAGELERALDLAALKVGAQGGILVLVDSDEDCPAERGPQLLQRALSSRNDLPVAVVLAKREFESWFLAAAESLRGQRSLPATLVAPADPESIAGAKEWLGERMATGRYAETLDQPALAAGFDLHLARRADSFDKCYREIVRLITSLRTAGTNNESSD